MAGSSNGQYRVSITAYSSERYFGPLPSAPTTLEGYQNQFGLSQTTHTDS